MVLTGNVRFTRRLRRVASLGATAAHALNHHLPSFIVHDATIQANRRPAGHDTHVSTPSVKLFHFPSIKYLVEEGTSGQYICLFTREPGARVADSTNEIASKPPVGSHQPSCISETDLFLEIRNHWQFPSMRKAKCMAEFVEKSAVTVSTDRTKG